MKNKKLKIIAFVLVFVLLIATVIVTSVANAKTTDVQITADRENISAGESATVSVKATTNYPVATMSIPVFYDKTLVDVSEAVATLSDYSVANTTTDSQSVDASKVYANTDIDESKFGFVLATYIGGANGEVAESIDEVVLTFKITAKASASGNAVVKVVEESAKTSENAKGMLYFGAVPKGKAITEIPENVESKSLDNAIANIKIGEKPNTGIGNENAPFAPAIDNVNVNPEGTFLATLYGFDTLGWNDAFEVDGTIIDFFTSAYGEDYVEIIVPDSAGVETTGTSINILDEEGNVIETYTYIYFGDVDMDGLVGASDAFICEAYEGTYDADFAGIGSYEQFVAADLDGDAFPGAGDAFFMEVYEATYTDLPRQADIAANIVDSGLVFEMI